MRRSALTSREVETLQSHGVHFVAPSLYLQIRPQGTRSWLFRYRRHGRNYWYGLGPAADVKYGKAREEADRLRVAVRQGAHPVEDKRAARAAAQEAVKVIPTFAQCARKYIGAHEKAWKSDKHAIQWPNTMRDYVYPVFGQMPVDQVGVPEVLQVLQPIWTTKAETAGRVRARIEAILGWATAMGYRSGANPAAWQGGALPHLLPPSKKAARVKHHGAVPYGELPALIAQLQANDSISAKALIFTILTASRTGETIGALWSEIDLEAGLWVIPKERMKAAREHRVPLAPPAVALLRGLDRQCEYVFPGPTGRRPLSNMAMLMLLRGIRGGVGETVHGMRSAFRDWAADCTDWPREVVEACLAHASGDAVELAYKRTDFLDKRRQLMADWATYCDGKAP